MADKVDVDSPHLSCNFCGKNRKEVKKLIAGPQVYICNECVDMCDEILEEQGVRPSPEHPDLGEVARRKFKEQTCHDIKAEILRFAETNGISDLTMRFVHDNRGTDLEPGGVILQRRDKSTAILFTKTHPQFHAYLNILKYGSLYREEVYKLGVVEVAAIIAKPVLTLLGMP